MPWRQAQISFKSTPCQGDRTTMRSQEQTSTATTHERMTQGETTLKDRRASNRDLLQQFLQEVDEGAEATPSSRDRDLTEHCTKCT